MASFNDVNHIVGLKAGEDLSDDSNKYIALQLDADGDVTTAEADTQKFIGFLQNTPDEGKPCDIAGMSGGSLAIASGAIPAGSFCETDANGHLVAIASADTANAVAIAEKTAADGDVFPVMVLAPGYSVTVA